jgi:predicted aldo/keto reductase-like oxidoreductase
MTHSTNFTRRDFLKVTGAAAMGSIIAPLDASADSPDEAVSMPTRPFGTTGVDVPILSLGGSLDLPLLILKNAFNWGVTYWDMAHSYMGGNSEKSVGKYLLKFPADRQKIFLVTKSYAWTLSEMTAELDQSLERMKTDYVDLFFVHGIGSIDELGNDMKVWADKTKAAGKIRFFGFSTHSNMEECMLAASKLGWIDGIMMSYNYRLMHTDLMKRAVGACVKAGIGLTAMKTQGGGSIETNLETDLKLTERFLKKGYSDAQAKLKAVWENPNIASVCSEMPNMTILMENVAAALNRTRLSARDIRALHQYAQNTRPDYCTGCANICESTFNGRIPISDIMRYLMYWRSYADFDRAVKHFNKIPEDIRRQMAGLDYSQAEQNCPQNMPIGKLIREAINELS